MRKKLLLLTVALGLAAAASSNAVPKPLYIICDSCTSTSATVQCKCATNSRHPGTISNCSRWITDCWNGSPP